MHVCVCACMCIHIFCCVQGFLLGHSLFHTLGLIFIPLYYSFLVDIIGKELNYLIEFLLWLYLNN